MRIIIKVRCFAMKICSYCGKEIDYNHIYCCDECDRNTFLYYKSRKKFQPVFSTVNITAFIAIIIGAFAGLITEILKLGMLISGSGVALLGLLNILLPFYGVDENIKKKGIITSKKNVKLLGIILLIAGAVMITVGIIVPFKVL